VPFEFGVGSTVGRESALAQLDATLDALEAGEPGCIALDGEPGIGKTHLLTELHRRAEERGYLVLRGSATEFERDLPFGVWADTLDAYVASQELDLGGAWTAENARELADIVPSLHRRARTQGGSVPDERYRAHRAARTLLELLARDRPLVVVLDDLHWADEASIELLATLLRRGPEAPVLLALAFRRGQAQVRLSAALASPAVGRISLDPLTECEANELLEGIEPRTAAAIYRHGGGNPFYLHQLRRAGEEGRLDAVLDEGAEAAAVSGVPVPSAVAASLAEELASLPVEQLALVRAAAVAGDPFEPDLAAAIAELPPSAGLEVLDALLARDLIRATSVPRRFVFRHPLVRRVVYESAPAGWRLGAHARAAGALEPRGAPAAERAHHAEQYAGQGDQKAIGLMLAAGMAAAERAPAAAARWFESALRLLPSQDERQVDVRVALASSLRALGELDRCRAALLEAHELLPADAVTRRVELTAHCAAVEHWLGRHEEAHRRLLRAWEELPDRTTAEAAALEIELTVDGLYELDFAQAVDMGLRALATARQVDDRPLIAAAAAALCLAETTAGNVVDADEHRREAREEVDALSDAELAPRLESLFHLAWAETYLEHYEDAVAHAERGIEIARTFGQGRLLVPLSLARNFPFEMQGRLHDAIELCESALEAARLSASAHELYRALFELGWTRYYAGDLEGALAAHEESSRVDPRLAGGTIPNGGGGPGWGLGVAWLESGQVERGRALLLELGGENVARTMPVERCFDWESLTLAELAVGDVGAAEGYARRAEHDAAQLGLKLPSALAGRARAAVLLARGEPLEAARVAHESAEAAGSVGARLQAAFSRALEGRALAAAGERLDAVAALRDAEQELDACGSVRVRDEMRRELRLLGARAEPRGPAAPGDSGIDALSKRELEIARLVTDRLTNREIAAALFLSDKTIESHLRNIFHKLGVTSRVEVARAVERERAESAGAQA
jgi:DNA-binding CsgD family transcriptional regulator/HPt (histidine-containing phosphotransfer) domain-containing protein